MSQSDRFAILRATERIWAVASIHGEAEKLAALHDEIALDLNFGDRIVYLGNYFGHGPDPLGVLEELLRFRSWFLAHPPFQHTDDIVFLRGAQEEMLWKLMQLQFAPDPPAVLDWMVERGIGSILSSLGYDVTDGRKRASEGTLALTYWTNRIREMTHSLAGYDPLFSSLKRAAYTDDGSLLFVHAGLDTERPLARQADAFWWAANSFLEIDRPYRGFRKIVRGFDPDHAGIQVGEHTISLDGGAGLNGSLNGILLSQSGELLRKIEI